MANNFRIVSQKNDGRRHLKRMQANNYENKPMKKILIIYNSLYGPNDAANRLAKSGFAVQSMDVEALDFSKFDPSAFDMAVINLYPDVSLSWRTYLDFKQRFPKFPVLLQMRREAVDRLQSVVKNIYRIGGGFIKPEHRSYPH